MEAILDDAREYSDPLDQSDDDLGRVRLFLFHVLRSLLTIHPRNLIFGPELLTSVFGELLRLKMIKQP